MNKSFFEIQTLVNQHQFDTAGNLLKTKIDEGIHIPDELHAYIYMADSALAVADFHTRKAIEQDTALTDEEEKSVDYHTTVAKIALTELIYILNTQYNGEPKTAYQIKQERQLRASKKRTNDKLLKEGGYRREDFFD